MIVVARRMSVVPATNESITSSSSVSESRPWAMPIVAPGTIARRALNPGFCRAFRPTVQWASW